MTTPAYHGRHIISTATYSHDTAAGLRRACECARIVDSLKGEETVVLDLTGVTPLFDYFIISTGRNRRQMHAMAEEVDRAMDEQGQDRLGIEGYQESSWIVQDYGDLVLHVFTQETRHRYELEELWADAPRVNWQAYLKSEENGYEGD